MIKTNPIENESGIGLINVKIRLEFINIDKYDFKIQNLKHSYSARRTIKK